ncbi:DEAD/DEAH box helicase family protein [Aerococcaceae bacterium DSM 111020]|nr:DEAD/DEAH box helicase family protein [Aerococcaceae bacterium DSM 111020]
MSELIYRIPLPLESVCWGRLITKREILRCSEIEWDVLKHKLTRIEAIQDKRCNRCSNHQMDFFGKIPKQPAFGFHTVRYYCLNCLNMGRMTEGDWLYYLESPSQFLLKINEILTWEGTLSPEQYRASQEIIKSLPDFNRPHMIYAVTGAGKTEMIFPVIATILKFGGRVVVASPRIDVCLELAPRLQEAFRQIPVQLLYGGQEEPYRYTPITVSTTHQLLRFKEAFDLVIVDEVDAFPYAGDDTLHYAVVRSKKPHGKLIYLTATPDDHLMKQVEHENLTLTTLPARYHRHPLPEPIFEWIGDWREAINKGNRTSRLFKLMERFFNIQGVKLFFVPSINMAEKLFRWIEHAAPDLAKQMTVVHSKDPQRKEKVQALRQGDYQALISTTILERGVTFTNCHVCIIGAEDRLYTLAALVQMSGRVGRKWDYPTGQLIYAHGGITRAMLSARSQILEMNRQAKERGLIDDTTSDR